MEQSAIDKLMELKKLYEAGILTKEELETEKQKILHQEDMQLTNTAVSETTNSSTSSNSKILIWLGILGGLILLFVIIIICMNSFRADSSYSDSVSDDYYYENSSYNDYDDNYDDW